MVSPTRFHHPIPAILAEAGFVATFVAVCIPGFSVAVPQLPVPGALGFVLFVVGLLLLLSSVFLATTEGIDRSQEPWVPVSVLSVSAVLPFLHEDVVYATDNRNWLITHVALIAILLSSKFISFEFIGLVLRIGMIASLVTLVGGATALSADERSLFLLDGRLRGIFGHANMTGLVAVATLLLALGNGRRWRKTDVLLSAIVIAAATSLTSLVAAGIGLAAWLVTGRAGKYAVWAVGMVSLFIPTAVVLAMGTQLDPGLFTGRTAAWQWALSLDVPSLTGLGIGLFAELGSGKLVPWFHTHNQVIMDFVSGGWPLVCTTVLLLAAVGLRAVRASDRRQLVMWSILILQCATEVPLVLNYPSGAMFSTSIILLLAIGAIHPDRSHTFGSQPKILLKDANATPQDTPIKDR